MASEFSIIMLLFFLAYMTLLTPCLFVVVFLCAFFRLFVFCCFYVILVCFYRMLNSVILTVLTVSCKKLNSHCLATPEYV